MPLPIIPEELFQVNPDYKVTSFDGDCLIIDDFYKNYEEIHSVLISMPVPRWKTSSTSRNFIDYYDCRPVINNPCPQEGYFNYLKTLGSFLRYFKDTSVYEEDSMNYTFNYYKNIKTNVSNSLQHMPHIDMAYNVIVYLDKICSGGTALYNIPAPVNTESENLLYDVSNVEKVVINAVPNRLVMFRGNKTHGGYIEDHTKYENDWRINQVKFLQERKS